MEKINEMSPMFISTYKWHITIGSYNHYLFAWLHVFYLLEYDDDRYEEYKSYLHDQAVLDSILQRCYGIRPNIIPLLIGSLIDFNKHLKTDLLYKQQINTELKKENEELKKMRALLK